MLSDSEQDYLDERLAESPEVQEAEAEYRRASDAVNNLVAGRSQLWEAIDELLDAGRGLAIRSSDAAFRLGLRAADDPTWQEIA